MKTVDEFVEQKVLPEFHDMVAIVRELCASAPRTRQRKSYELPMWIGKSTIGWISPTKRDIPLGLLTGGV